MPDTTETETNPEPLHAARIEDYALIGDCETAALISCDGSIDWLCWPTFQSPACLAALLGTTENGYWRVHPADKITNTRRRYRPGTMIVETTFETADGEVLLTDFMPPRGDHSNIVRMVRGVRGRVPMRMDFVLRFDYGRTIPWVTMRGDELRAVAGPHMVTLRQPGLSGSKAELRGENMTTVSDFSVSQGDEICFALTYSDSLADSPPEPSVQVALADTETFWCDWTAKSQYKGDYTEAVSRSLLTLEAMTYKPTGGMVAAVTAGLPELIGGERNWDYRYCWLRDTSFTLLILLTAGYTEEALRWRKWLLRAIAGSPDQIQALYSISGERQLVEWEATWLRGYKDSRPVRIGNAATEQFQLDVFGEVAVALGKTPQAQEDDIRTPSLALLSSIVDHVCKVWDQPDEGIWEVRGPRRHFVYSKVMAWVALDRSIRHHEEHNGNGDLDRWRKNRDMLHQEICDQGFDVELNSFTQSYHSKSLDASCLLLLIVGFLPVDDPRIVGTVEAIQKHLTQDGLVLRYQASTAVDGLAGKEGVFLACSFWMVTCLSLLHRTDEARALFERLLSLRNDVGLLSEEYDPGAKRMLGNFPQALTHIALAHAAFALSGQWHPHRTGGEGKPSS